MWSKERVIEELERLSVIYNYVSKSRLSFELLKKYVEVDDYKDGVPLHSLLFIYLRMDYFIYRGFRKEKESIYRVLEYLLPNYYAYSLDPDPDSSLQKEIFIYSEEFYRKVD